LEENMNGNSPIKTTREPMLSDSEGVVRQPNTDDTPPTQSQQGTPVEKNPVLGGARLRKSGISQGL
jgi:hypothetical protein